MVRPRRTSSLVVVAAFCATGCGASGSGAIAWGPVPVEAGARAPRSPLTVSVADEGAGDLAAVLRASVQHARLGTLSSRTLTLHVVAEKTLAPPAGLSLARLRFEIREGHDVLFEDTLAATAFLPDEARRLVLARLLVRVEAGLARLGESTRLDAVGSEIPRVVVIERFAHTRDAVERVFLETTTGTPLRREIHDVLDAAAGPPGRWLLSYETAEGHRSSPAAYASMVRSLAPRLDLRDVGDATRVGYFGPKPALSDGPTPSSPSSLSPKARTSTPKDR